MYDDDYIIKTTGVSRRYLGFLKDILQGLKEDENGELELKYYKKGMLYMTIKDDFQDAYDRAYEKGIKIGVESIAIAMLKHKCADSVIKSVTEISEETLDRLKNKNKEDSQDTEEIARNKIYEAGYNEGYNEGYAVGCQECWEEATSEVRACPVRECPCKP